jgi:multisubunit Na+/H+ antiporter MnhB subunit
MTSAAAFDVLLALGLLVLAVPVVAARTPFRAVVMFTVFGLLMAVAWARLGSPNLALAEAAIGAGLTGAMFLLHLRRVHALGGRPVPPRAPTPRRRQLVAAAVGLGCAALVLLLAGDLAQLPVPSDTAGDATRAALPGTGVGNAVTAVLILFRGYDTMLEMLVLLIAWLGIKAVQPVSHPIAPLARAPAALLDALLAAVVPSAILVGGYLLHAGGQAPGGAFQAGAVLAAAGVLLVLSGRVRTLREPLPLQRVGLVMGVAVFAAVGLAGLRHGAPMRIEATGLVYVVEAALMLSIALSLVLLFLGSAGLRRAA